MLLIKNIRLIDPASGRDENTDILADETGVIKLSPGGSIEPGDLDEDTLMIDGTDLVACPGLWMCTYTSGIRALSTKKILRPEPWRQRREALPPWSAWQVQSLRLTARR